MAKPTTEELQAELEDVVNRHNQAKAIVNQCKERYIALEAIIKDRTTPESDAT